MRRKSVHMSAKLVTTQELGLLFHAYNNKKISPKSHVGRKMTVIANPSEGGSVHSLASDNERDETIRFVHGRIGGKRPASLSFATSTTACVLTNKREYSLR